MGMLILCLVLLYFGFGALIYGVNANVNVGTAVMNAVSGQGMRGTIWVVIGILAVLLGSALLIYREYRREHPKKKY